PIDVGIVGDPGQVIGQVLEAGVGAVEEPSWTGEIRAEEERLLNEAKAGMESDAVPIHPQRFAREIRDFLDQDAIVVGDGGGIVGNDGAWGQIKVAQEALYGQGNAPASELDPEAPYHKMVDGLGGYGEKVTSPNQIKPALQRAFDSGVAACLNVMVDPTLMKRSSYLA